MKPYETAVLLRFGTFLKVAHMRSRYNGSCITAKKATGRHVTAYIGNAAYLSSSLRRKKCPAQKETSIAPIDIKRDDKPNNILLGKLRPKSLSWCLEVRTARNMTREFTEKHRAMSDEMENTLNAGLRSRVGVPFPSLMPPGTVADVAKATVAMSAATTEHELEVVLSHALPFFTSSSCFSVKICLAVLLALL